MASLRPLDAYGAISDVEKTIHPCQFPAELVERFILSCTAPGDIVLDPYAGVMTTVAAALMHGRKGAGAEIVAEYVEIGRQRVELARSGLLRTRPMDRPVYSPSGHERVAQRPSDVNREALRQMVESARQSAEPAPSLEPYALKRGYTKRLLEQSEQ